MSRLTLLPAAERQVQPWRNGGGTTIEIAAFPPSAGLERFDWRISTATVAAAGRFSHFAGVDRTLAVVQGRLELAFERSAAVIALGTDSPAHAFPGDVGCVGKPVGGEVVDLNLMVRRGRWSGTIEQLTSPETAPIALSSRCAVILFVDQGRLQWRSNTLSLQPWDAVRIDDAAGESVVLDSDGAVYILSLSADAP